MGIDSFPKFEMGFFEPNLEQTYVSAARAEYDRKTMRHALILPKEAEVPKFLIFHELTHIYDMETYKTGNNNYDFCLTGFMEYHASQIELMLLMGAQSVDDKISFSINDPSHHMDWMVREYLENKLYCACDLIESESRDKRIAGLDVFYNFLGLKSVCSMYATDFEDDFTYRSVAERLPMNLMLEIRKYMTGWITDPEYAVILYSNAVKRIK